MRGKAPHFPSFILSKKSGTVKIRQQIRSVIWNRKAEFCVPCFQSSRSILSLRGGRVRPTRQSLTMRFVIPKRNMIARDETKPWNEERTQNDAAIPMFFVISIPFCYVLPFFGAGCHAFDFQIATAALRPRNDTKLERFCLENRRFSFFAVIFCAVLLCTVFQTFRSGNCSVFPQNLPNLSLRGGRVRPTRQSLTMRFAIPKRTMVGRNETEPWKEERGTRNKAAIPMFFAIGIPFCYVLPCFGAGCHTFDFQIATSLRSSQ